MIVYMVQERPEPDQRNPHTWMEIKMKMKKMFAVSEKNPAGMKFADNANFDKLLNFVGQFGVTENFINEIEVPWLELGDRIIISKCVGFSEDDDGIISGGNWVDIEGVWAAPVGSHAGRMIDNSGNFIQIVNADMCYDGFPYRDVRLAS